MSEQKKSTDEGVTVKIAKAALEELETAEEVAAYTEGDDREGVKKAASGRIKQITEAEATRDPEDTETVEVPAGVLKEITEAVTHKVNADQKFRGLQQPNKVDKALIEAKKVLESLT